MFIKYNNSNCHALPHLRMRNVTMVNKTTGAKRTVKKLETNQAPEDIKWLRPGWNEFPKEVWEQNKDHPQIQKMIRKGKIELLTEKVTVTKDEKKSLVAVGLEDRQIRLKWFIPKRAVKIVSETHDRDLLQRWLAEESRHTVKKRIEKQLEPLLTQPQTDDDGDDDGDDDE